MTISVVGTGYVGLVTAAIFSDFGNKVYGIDIDEEKIKTLNSGKIPFFEPGLEELVKRNLANKHLVFGADYVPAIAVSDIVFICVGTPPKNNGEADLSYVFSAAESIARHLKDYTVIVIKSTVPVCTNDKIREIIQRHTKAKFDLASVPEFLKEGSAVSDCLLPDRVVIGAESKKAIDLLLNLHKPINGERLICDTKSAQMIKYAANSLLSTKISFANAMAIICEKSGANVESVLNGVGLDKRLGRSFLYPGVGYGGSCFPKDVLALIATAKNYGYDFDLLKAVDNINKNQPVFFVEKVRKLLGNNVTGKIIGVLGLAFKPNTDDMREAPSIKIIQALQKLEAKIQAYDPAATQQAKKILPKVKFCQDPYEVAQGADVLCIITEWNEFKELNLKKIKRVMKQPVIADGRNIYDREQVQKVGFTYEGIGR